MSAFEVVATDGAARRGRLATNHGVVETPAFMPVGTTGTVKSLMPAEVEAAGAQIVLANTYHLLLRPGPEVLSRLGGLHGFARIDLPLLTDSGGYQVMSLAKFRRITDEGVVFRNHLDGSEVFLTPERSLEVQRAIRSDVQMVLDVCPAADAHPDEVRRATELSLVWAKRSLEVPRDAGVLRFGIVQGGLSAEGRAASARATAGLPFDGYAVGGLSVGEPEPIMLAMLDAAVPHLPEDKPRYLMGVGKPGQILDAVRRGMDLFDCVLPTRLGRHGTLWTSEGVYKVDRSEHAADGRPVDPACDCLLCANFSRAYLRHAFRVEEPLYLRLASLHNLRFLLRWMKKIREAIEANALAELRAPEGIG